VCLKISRCGGIAGLLVAATLVREIFRHTASAAPAPSAPGSALVSSIATRTGTRSRTSRTA